MNLNPMTWDWNEKKAVGRHVLNSACSVVATLAVVGLFSDQDAGTITQGLNDIGAGLAQFAKGVAAIAGVMVPIYTALKAKSSANPNNQVAAVVENLKKNGGLTGPSVVTTEARKDLIDAVAKMPEVQGVVAPAVADIPNPKVVATAAEVR